MLPGCQNAIRKSEDGDEIVEFALEPFPHRFGRVHF